MKLSQREKFIYNTQYGTTTDIYSLPIRTEFFVINGAWRGLVLEKDGKKIIQPVDEKHTSSFEVKEDVDYGLVTIIERDDSEIKDRQMGVNLDGAVFNYDGSNLDLFQLLEKLESVGLELGASTQPIDEEGDLYNCTSDWKTGEFVKNQFE